MRRIRAAVAAAAPMHARRRRTRSNRWVTTSARAASPNWRARWNTLGASGVHFMQGCLFGRPVEKEAMTERLAEKQAAVSRFEAAGVAV
jgi:hypothetical protein